MKNKVKMLKSMPGVHDGELHPVPFIEGEEYEIGPDLLQAFINCGAVSLTGGDVAEEANSEADQMLEVDSSTTETAETEAKSEGDAPANKVKKAAPENKAKK